MADSAPKTDSRPKAAAKSTELADLIAGVEKAAQGLSGYDRVVHDLDVAFAHALAGAEAEARALLAHAEAEIERFAPALAHLHREFGTMKAKVIAAVHRK